MQQTISYGRQEISPTDIEGVIAVLKSDFLTQGPMVPRFEQLLSSTCGAKYAVAVNSATAALHLACLAVGVGAGDTVWTSPITFVASANCALYCGAGIDFVDIDPRTYNLCPEKLAQKLEKAEKTGTLPKVVIPVHLAGQPCEMRAIHALSQKYGFRIIEDASHAIGGKYLNEPIGNCRYSDITVFSFHPVKIITTGEGGAALTNNPQLHSIMSRLRTHGITREPAEMQNVAEGPWYYEQVDLGFNYRLTDMQAALGVSQIARLSEFVAKRHEISERYDSMLKNFPVTLPWQHPDGYSGLHLYIIRLRLAELKCSRLEVFNNLRSRGILVNVHYIPVYHQPYYEQFNFNRQDFPEAESYYSEAISLPMFPTLNERQQNYVVDTLGSLIAK